MSECIHGQPLHGACILCNERGFELAPEPTATTSAIDPAVQARIAELKSELGAAIERRLSAQPSPDAPAIKVGGKQIIDFLRQQLFARDEHCEAHACDALCEAMNTLQCHECWEPRWDCKCAEVIAPQAPVVAADAAQGGEQGEGPGAPYHISISGGDEHAKVFPQEGIHDPLALADYLDQRLNPLSSIPCDRCGGPCIEFTVPNDIWNAVVRTDGRERDDEYICQGCWYELLRKRLIPAPSVAEPAKCGTCGDTKMLIDWDLREPCPDCTPAREAKCVCGEQKRPICKDYDFREDDNGEQFDECIHCLHKCACHADEVKP